MIKPLKSGPNRSVSGHATQEPTEKGPRRAEGLLASLVNGPLPSWALFQLVSVTFRVVLSFPHDYSSRKGSSMSNHEGEGFTFAITHGRKSQIFQFAKPFHPLKTMKQGSIPSRFLRGGMVIPPRFLRGGMVIPSRFLCGGMKICPKRYNKRE